ncbi:MAG: MFS transporter [Actinomycetia bacterium]|nr:MFS transporter [Actinomycetes bacterium]MCP5033679.1 MFS transporter [Actinomycetes bacterium]
MVGAGAAIQALHSGLMTQAFGNYAVLLQREFGWTRTLFSAAYSLTRAESGLLGPAQGWALDRFGTKAVMRVGVVVMAAGFIALSQIQNATQFIIAYLIMAVGMSLSGFLSITTATVRWFERRRARALALSGTGFAIGGIVTPVVVYCLRTFGWRWTAAVSGLLLFAIAMPLTFWFGDSPQSKGEHVDGIDPDTVQIARARAEGVSDVHFTAREAMRTRAFWMISLGHASALLVVGAVIAHLSLYLTEEQGFTLQQASFVGGALPLLQFVGQLAGGILGDRVNKRLLASLAMLGHMGGLLLLTYATTRWMIWLFIPFHGFAWGLRGPLMQALRADYFGSTSFGQIMGASSMVVMFGMVGGPLIAGSLADATGTYRLGFTVLALMAGAGLIFFVLATPPSPPLRSVADPDPSISPPAS